MECQNDKVNFFKCLGMQCAACGNPDSSCIRLQPSTVTLLQKYLSAKVEIESSSVSMCRPCCDQLFAWSVCNDKIKSSLNPISLRVLTQGYDMKQEPPSPHCLSDSDGESSDPCETTNICGPEDSSIFFPEIKLEVQEGEVLSEIGQPVPQGSLQPALLLNSKMAMLPLYITNTRANKPGNSFQTSDYSDDIIATRRSGYQQLNYSKNYCDKCDKVFKKSSNLKRHMTIHSENRSLYYCSFCHAHFGNREQIRSHILQKHLNQRSFKCEHCEMSFKRFQHLKRHTEIKHNPNKVLYPCEFCGKNFNSVHNKGFHIIRVHAQQLSGSKQQHSETNRPGLACDVCGKLVKTVDNLKRHRLLHSDNKPTFKCRECGKLLSRKDKLKEHMLANHSGKGPVRCEVCGKLIPNEVSHRRHMQLHSADRPVFPCPCCGKFYTSTTSRAYHMIQVHSAGQDRVLLPRISSVAKPRSKECHVCGKTMMHYKSLKGHLERHARSNGAAENTKLSLLADNEAAISENNISTNSG